MVPEEGKLKVINVEIDYSLAQPFRKDSDLFDSTDAGFVSSDPRRAGSVLPNPKLRTRLD